MNIRPADSGHVKIFFQDHAPLGRIASWNDIFIVLDFAGDVKLGFTMDLLNLFKVTISS